MSLKQEMRDVARDLRREFVGSCTPEKLQELEWQRTQQFLGLEAVQKILNDGGRAGVYYPLQEEASTTLLIKTLHDNNIPLALPRIMGKGLVFQAWRVGDGLVQSPFGVMEPLAEAPVVKPAIHIVPLIAFDPQNHRLGYGKGHYDRYFEAHPKALKVGWAYPCQCANMFPVETHDVSLDYVITGEGQKKDQT